MDAQSKLDRLAQLIGVPLGRLEATVGGNTLTITSHLPGPPPEWGGRKPSRNAFLSPRRPTPLLP